MAYRRARGDMIEVFKIVAQIYDNKTTDNVPSFRENMNISLRGHEFTLEHKRLSCPARIHFFAKRIVNNWNSLPNHVRCKCRFTEYFQKFIRQVMGKTRFTVQL